MSPGTNHQRKGTYQRRGTKANHLRREILTNHQRKGTLTNHLMRGIREERKDQPRRTNLRRS